MTAARALSVGAALLLLGAFAAGCRSRSGNDTAGKTASAHSIDVLSSVTVPEATATPAPAPDCSPARPHAPGDENGTIASGGLQRTYIVHVPPSYDGAHAMPLVEGH